jgi:hypothetical protein
MVAKHSKTDGDAALATRKNSGEESGSAVAAVTEPLPPDLAGIDPALAALIPQEFVETEIGFPPYWKAAVNKGFRGIILGYDDRDPDFIRIHIENSGPPIDCQRGPVDDGVISTVSTGRIFTISKFGALPLEQYIGVDVVVLCVGSRKLPGNEASRNVPRDLFEWRVFVSKDVENLLRSRRAQEREQLAKLQQEARTKMLAEIANINARKLAEKTGGSVINTTGVSA